MHVVVKTDPTLQANKIIYTNELRISRGNPVPSAKSFLREGFCLKIESSMLTAPLIERQNAYRLAFAQYRATEIQADNAERRASVNKARKLRGIEFQ
jgi:hypothetical protein